MRKEETRTYVGTPGGFETEAVAARRVRFSVSVPDKMNTIANGTVGAATDTDLIAGLWASRDDCVEQQLCSTLVPQSCPIMAQQSFSAALICESGTHSTETVIASTSKSAVAMGRSVCLTVKNICF
jgi:hypothetical protein